jgi:hypothetical protein
MTIFERIKMLNFPFGKYVVVGGAMEAHGIRTANDIDIVVTQDLFNELEKESWDEIKTYPEQSYGIKKILKKEGLDIISHYSYNEDYYKPAEELMASADIIEGIPFVSLHELLQWKKAAKREKDIQDVLLIEKYLFEQ